MIKHEDVIKDIKSNFAQDKKSTADILKGITEAIKTVTQFDGMNKVIEEYYDASPVVISTDTAKALIVFSGVLSKKYAGKNPVLLFDSLKRGDHNFKGVLKPLNDLSTQDFMKMLMKDFKIENPSVKDDAETKEAYEQGDIVQYKSTKEYGYVESVIEGTSVQVWSNEVVKWASYSEIKKVTDKDEKLMAEILMNWKTGMKIYCYDKDDRNVAKFMIITGESEKEFQIMNMDNFTIVPHSNTNSRYNIVHFIVKNIQPVTIEVM